MRTFSKPLVAIILALSIGAQWPLLQSVAWLNMLVTYSTQDGIQRAVSKTFDGNHPCKLCKFVSEGKEVEKKNSHQATAKKFDLIMVASVPLLFPSNAFIAHADVAQTPCLRLYPPLSPPPDFA